MLPLGDAASKRSVPIVTWTLILLNVIVYVWDRQGNPLGPAVVFSDLAMRPKDVVDALNETGGNRFALVTVFTSMFLHGGLLHIGGNMIFLAVFGGSVEDAIGSIRFPLYYLFWGVVAAFTQIYVDPQSTIPTIGASGAIGGVLGAYLLLFPARKILVVFPLLLFAAFEVSAWALLGVWFMWQIFIPQDGIANWAHVGGFLAGMATVLVMGGRTAILGTRPDEYELV